MEFIPKLFFNEILSEYLNPVLKSNGFKKEKGNNWTKTNGDIFIIIAMQKSKIRIDREVSFRFYLQMCPNVIKNEKQIVDGIEIDWKSNYQSFCVEFDDVLPKERKSFKFHNHGWLGWYVIFRQNLCEQLLNEALKVDFENYIIPIVNKINSIEVYNKVKIKMKTRKDIHLGIADII